MSTAVFQVFVDSDVVISSLLSDSGAGFLLLNQLSKDIKISVRFFISNVSKKEIRIVGQRLNIDKTKTDKLIKSNLNIVKIKEPVANLKKNFKSYTSDPNDTHIVAGAKAAKAKFIISYNIRDFNVEKIGKDLKISTLTPAKFLQYVRSQGIII